MAEGLSSSVLLWSAVLLAGLLLLVGLAVYFSLGETIRSRKWVETPCTIVLSQINRADNGRLYWNVLYDYEFGGQSYRGQRFEILQYLSDDWGDIAELVDQYPKGKQGVCFVDPSQPENAVLSRRIRPAVWLLVAPALMVLVGIGGLAAPHLRSSQPEPLPPVESYREEPFPEDLEPDPPRPAADGRG
jgi:hypothetical protein